MTLFSGLSGRLLILTILVVMLVEVAIFVPSVARFRADYLQERVVRAQIASMTVLTAPDEMVSPELQRQLLEMSEALNIVLQREGTRTLILTKGDMPEITETYDLREMAALQMIVEALDRLLSPGGDIVRVIG